MKHLRFVTGICCLAAAVLSLPLRAEAQIDAKQLPGILPGAQGIGPAPSDLLKTSAYFTRPTGGRSTLYVVAELAPGWHIYSLSQAPGGPNKSKIKLPDSPTYKLAGTFTADQQPEVHEYPDIWPGLKVEEHHGRIVWSAPLELSAGVDPATLEIAGAVNAQVCAKECLPPQDYKFVARLSDAQAQPQSAPAAPAAQIDDPRSHAPPGNETPSRSAASTPAVPSTGFDESLIAQNVQTNDSLGVILLSAFFGGMILNLMPCVFPVIGLKILSFVEQSHHDRGRLLALNLWYSLGVLLVFLALAAVAIGLRTFLNIDFKYGNQNAIQGYAIGMAAVMFVMGISLLGVWEIPIPGFLGTGKAGHIMQQEGPAGALAKGAITTLLGASCSGPVVAVAFTFALDRSTPAWATLGTFAVIGLGMAFPYLVLGANPRLLRFLPKPGAWMDTFKHVCGFILLAAMVWVLTFIKPVYVAPTVAFLVGLWAACWLIGRVPATAHRGRRLEVWAWATVVSLAAGVFAFQWLAPVMAEKFEAQVNSEIAKRLQQGDPTMSTAPTEEATADKGSRLPWRPFSKDLLRQLTREGKTVMVDFTADWCLNCKALEKAVLNTTDVKSVVLRNGVVALVADYTDAPPELTEMLNLLKAGAVPVLAIFPASNPNNPIVFRGGYTKQTLIDALDEAGPSSTTAKQTAMN